MSVAVIEHKIAVIQPSQLAAFLDKAALLQHDPQKLLDGEELISYFTIPSLEEASRIAVNASEEEKLARQKGFFNPALMARSKLGQGMHDRGEAKAFTGLPVNEEDQQAINRHLPFHAKSISVLHKIIRTGETWDVSVFPARWGLKDMEELYCIVNVGTLTIEKGGRLIIRGNVFNFLCQHLNCITGDEGDYHIGIMPTPFSVDMREGPLDGANGELGQHGEHGAMGNEVRTNQSILGPWIDEQIVFDNNGKSGKDGIPGNDGVNGRNGGMCKIAELTIRSLDGKLTVYSQAGRGGDGGNGGPGGNGGDGGNGHAGAFGFNKTIAGGNGGNGGKGGNGGRGGNGGNGGLSSNIYISVPLQQINNVKMIAVAPIAGKPGNGGDAGHGGKGGDASLAVERLPSGVMGQKGADGVAGKKGIAGRTRAVANYYLNNIHQSNHLNNSL